MTLDAILLPDLQKEGHAGEFQVLSVQVPSKETGSPGFNVTAGPATQSEVFVHTAALSVSKLVVKSVLWEAYPNL